MKNRLKLLRMALALGILGVITSQGLAQETGSAAKGSAINVSEITQQSTQTTARRSPHTDHKRKQKDPQYLPVDQKSQLAEGTPLVSAQSIATVEPHTLPEMSPAASLSFVALPDSGEVAPPDTFGAVGPTHLVVACASDLRMSTRLGGVISTISQEHFWTNVARNIFDTRVVYDPYGQRFIMTAAADPGGPNPRLCIAVSDNSNPTGTWYRWSEDVDATSPVYADSPTVGFNKTWIVVQANMYNKTTFQFTRSDVYAYNKANLYANGTGQRTRLTFPGGMGGSQVPATMYDPAISVVYFAANWNGYVTNEFGEDFGYLRLFSMSGGIGSERLNVTNSFGEEIFIQIGRAWAESASGNADILPQLGNSTNIYAGDSRIQNVHFRDGLLYMAHTVFLPAEAPTRAAVQWWSVTAGNGAIRHFGRVDDTNGVNMFAYPSIAANQYHDVLLGYSRFSANEYAGAAYSFRRDTDATDHLRGQVLLKAGEATYVERIGGQNRWGDWSAATVDPVNDVDLWTIQEYAAPRALSGGSRWGTWWGRVSPPVDLAITGSGQPNQVPSGNQITYTLHITNKLDEILSGVRLEDTLPPGSTYVSSTTTKGSCGHTNGVLSCFIGPMAEFEAQTITLTVTAGLPSFVTNTAVISANGPDFDTSDNTALTVTEILNSADLQVQGLDNPDPVHVGNTLTYTLTISNRGPSVAGGVVMTSTLPASVTIGAVTGPGTWSINGNVVSFTLGSINIGATAVITINCTANAGGMVTNQVRIAANTFDTSAANNSVNIATLINARPVITQIGTQTINEDVPTLIPITISDAETAAGSLQFSAASSNQGLIPNSNISPGGTGQSRSLTITSAPNQFGSNTTTITVTVTDGHGASTQMQFAINVAAVNDPPTISNIPNPPAILEDSFTNLTFTISDIDNAIEVLTLSADSANSTLIPAGSISFSGTGNSRNVLLTPLPNRSGTSTITITVSDGSLSASDPFVLTVSAVNDPPVISGIDAQTTSEDTQTAAIPFTVSDPETPAASLNVIATSSDLALVPNGNIFQTNLGTNRTVRVAPAANQSGVATITLRVTDGTNSHTTTFDVAILDVNDPPTLTRPSNLTTNEDVGPITVPLTGIGSGAPNESQTLTVTPSTSTPDLVENLQVAYTSPNATGTLTFDLVRDANGTAVINLKVSDGNAADDVTQTFNLTINAINDPPTIGFIDSPSVPEDSPEQTIILTGISSGPANEADQTVTFSVDSSAPGLVPDPQIIYTPGASTATLRYTPVRNANGLATITVTANDGRPLNPTATRTFQITVQSVNDDPTMAPHLGDRRITEDASTGAIPFNFRDVEAGALTVVAFSSNQGLVPDANVVITPSTGTNRNLNITPVPNEFGTAFITVQITDSEGGATNQTFLLTVDPVNDPPTLSPPPTLIVIEEDAPAQTVNLSGISPGPSNESTQAVRILASSSNPAIVPDPQVSYAFPNTTGLLTFTPSANATGSVVITVTADDREPANNTMARNFTVQINSVNDAPTIVGDFEIKFTDEDAPLVLTNVIVGDVETAPGSLTLRGSSSNQELVSDTGITFSGSGATKTVTVQPLANEFGSTSITITVRDSGGAETSVSFELFVNEVNDTPSITAPGAQTISEDTATGTLPFSVSDSDTPVLGLNISAHSSDQSIVPDANIELGWSGSTPTVRVTPAANANGPVDIFLTASDGNSDRTSQFRLNINALNDPPLFDDIPTLNLLEDPGLQVVTLTGVSPGAANETTDVLTVTAVSSAPGLIPNPAGTNDNGVLKLRFTPVANGSGSANVTVTVSDGRPLNPTTTKNFTVNVQQINDPPTLNTINPVVLSEDAGFRSVSLSGISAGGGENQPLTFTAVSSNPTLVALSNPAVLYTNTTGALRFTVAGNSSGSSIITVRLSDGLSETTQVFTVTVNDVNEAPVFVSPVASSLTTPEDTPIAAQFTVMDEESYSARLTLTATSTNTTLVPNANVTFDGSDSNRWVIVTPATNQFGPTRIIVSASDGTNSSTMAFNLNVTSVNDMPTLNPLPDLALTQNPPNQTINLSGITSGAPNENNQALSIRVTSSNSALVPAPNTVTYTSPNPTASFVLNAANQGTGLSIITVTVWDNGAPSNNVTRNFTVYIRDNANSLPTLTGLSNRMTMEDTSIAIPFAIGDSTTPVANLTFGATGSNTELVPPSGIAFSGIGNNRTLTITPGRDKTGSTVVTVWVQDDQFGYTSSNFVLQVTAANDLPLISTIQPQTIDRNANLPPVPFTVGDAETPAQNLNVGASSSNQGLLPNANIFFGGSGTNRSIIAYPTAGQIGSAIITVTVTDGNSASASTQFSLTVRPPQLPALTIRRSGSNVELLWPTEAGLLTLQGRDQLNSGNWADIVVTPGVSGTNYVVPQSPTGPRKFFRLRN